MLTVRTARLSDLTAIQEICSQTWYDTYQTIYPKTYIDRVVEEFYGKERLTKDLTQLSEEWHGYWVAEQDGQIVGCIGGGVDQDKRGHIYVLYVALHCQGQGAGSLLVDHLTQYQKSKYQVTEQWVAVTQGNLKAIRFYEKVGFVLDHVAENFHDPNQVKSCHYRRPL